MSKVEIKITVDTAKLKSEKPGEIQDRSIVVMTDNQKDSFYDDPTKNNYKDKLHTMVDAGNLVEWRIVALNKEDKLSLVACKGEDLEKVFDGEPVHEKESKKMKVKIKSGLEANEKVWYTFTFLFNKEEYSWDPLVETRKI